MGKIIFGMIAYEIIIILIVLAIVGYAELKRRKQ